MAAIYVRCAHTRDNRYQECILVLTADRMACLPIGPVENAIGKIAGALALTAVGAIEVRIGKMVVHPEALATLEQLDAAVLGAGGFYVDADWTYRTNVPVIGTMVMRGKEVLTIRERMPPQMLARLTPNTSPPQMKAVKVVVGIGAAIILAAVIAFLASGSLEVLFGIGFWGVLIIGAALYAWLRLRRGQTPGPPPPRSPPP
jgi:hypothetical protein